MDGQFSASPWGKARVAGTQPEEFRKFRIFLDSAGESVAVYYWDEKDPSRTDKLRNASQCFTMLLLRSHVQCAQRSQLSDLSQGWS